MLAAGALALPTGIVVDGWVVVDGERVHAVGTGPPPAPTCPSSWGWWRPASSTCTCTAVAGRRSTAATRRRWRTVVRTHLAHGTTTMVASLVTDSLDGLAASCSSLASLADDGVVAGIHLEGPWLSPARAGAHEPSLIVDPTASAVSRLVEASRGHLRMVTHRPRADPVP